MFFLHMPLEVVISQIAWLAIHVQQASGTRTGNSIIFRMCHALLSRRPKCLHKVSMRLCIPNHHSTIHSARAKLAHRTTITLKDTQSLDGVLMHSLELRVVLGLAF